MTAQGAAQHGVISEGLEGVEPMEGFEGVDGGAGYEGVDSLEDVLHSATSAAVGSEPGVAMGRAGEGAEGLQGGSVTVVRVRGDGGESGDGSTLITTQKVTTLTSGEVGEGTEGEGSSGQGFSQTITTTTATSVGSAPGGGSEGSGGSGTRVVRRPILSSASMDGTEEEGLFEEGVEEVVTGFEDRHTRASTSSTDGTNFGLATETKTAESEELSKAEMEERKTFVIRSVVNPEDQSDISLQQAIMAGIINPNEGIYVNKVTGESIPIPVAMGAGLIKVEFTTVRRTQEKKSSIGIITVKTIRESEP